LPDNDLLSRLFARRRLGLRPGLERVRALLSRLGHPEDAFFAAVVAGTNGKGSTARALAAMLQASGRRTGLFLSPHLSRYNERFWVDGQEIGDERLFSLIERVLPHAEATGATFFEISAALAFLYFAEAGVDWAVLEVGLGGRLDAVNVKDAEIALVTAIDHDHTGFLGETLYSIAREKAGVFRPGRPALTSARGEGLLGLVEAAREKRTPLVVVRPDGVWPRREGLIFSVDNRRYATPLFGRHQGENLALAVRAARRLVVGEKAITAALKGLAHPGRLERIGPYLLDGAHNPAGARALARALVDHYPDQPRVLVFAASRDKDHRAMAEALKGLFTAVYLTRYPGERAAEPKDLWTAFGGGEVVADPFEAVARAKAAHPGALVVVAGSLYLLGALRPYLVQSGERPLAPPL